MPFADPQPQLLGVDTNHPRVDLGHQARRARAHPLQVAGQGERARAEVVGPERLSGWVGRIDDRGDRPGVGEPQVGRVIQVDIGVGRTVEQQHPAAGPLPVHGHDRAVVDGLGIAAAGCDGDAHAAGNDQQGRDHGGPPAPGANLEDGRGQDQPDAEADHDGADRGAGDQHEAGQHRADDGTGGADAGQPADDRSGLVEAGQPELGDHRGDRGEHRARQHDGHHRDDREQERPVSTAAAERTAAGVTATTTPAIPNSGPRARRGSTRSASPASRPRAHGDGRQGQPDDHGAGLQGETEVGGQQPQHHHLDDQHAAEEPKTSAAAAAAAQALGAGHRWAGHRWIMAPRDKWGRTRNVLSAGPACGCRPARPPNPRRRGSAWRPRSVPPGCPAARLPLPPYAVQLLCAKPSPP